jgi:quercetin dioxygenase-like cupin family protein
MTILETYRQFTDSRGEIRGVINDGQWEEINYVETAAHAVRGGHYHRDTRELFLILRGSVRVRTRARHGAHIEEHVFDAGSIFVVEPWEAHWFEAVTPCAWINVLSKRIDQDAPDIVPVAA